MIPQFEKLTEEEIEFLLKAPVLVSVLAASINHKISKIVKADAIKLAHLKTFTTVPLLRPYYKEVEKNFNKYFEIIEKNYAPFDEEKIDALKKELHNLYAVISKLDKEYAETLRWSLAKYTDHVKKSEHVFVENFIFPFLTHRFTEDY